MDKPKPSENDQKLLPSIKIFLAVLLVIILISASWWWYIQAQQSNDSQTQNDASTNQPGDLVTKEDLVVQTVDSNNWQTCANADLKVQIQYPDHWVCTIDQAPIDFNHNLVLFKTTEGNQIIIVDLFEPPAFAQDSGTRQKVGTITIGDQAKDVYFWPDRTDAPKIYEQLAHDEANNVSLILLADYPQLTDENLQEFGQILKTLKVDR